MPDSLVEAVTRYTNAQRGESPFATAIAGFTILRSNNEKHPSHTILKPALCVVVQGAKWTSVGTRRFQYKAVPSAFHRQFKALTSMTPLQYQKRLRLLEARRLMVSAAANVETAAFQVGYESPSQFSREYSRMFGLPPRRDISSLRQVAA